MAYAVGFFRERSGFLKKIGLYIHIPFCKSKCPYCDFYSKSGTVDEFNTYTNSVIEAMHYWKNRINATADTLYFGGGTPSLIGGENIAKLVLSAKELFKMDNNAEITVECNPSAVQNDFFKVISDVGVNRASIGMQSSVDAERRSLGRTADGKKVSDTVKSAKAAGISNVSLDVMLGIPNQTQNTLTQSLEFCAEQEVKHISAYILSLEEGTYFFKNKNKLNLPDDDSVADMYLSINNILKKYGYTHYEISNFAIKGYESKHNLKYWKDEEYLGIGPSAHSFIAGKRFYYNRDIGEFINNCEKTYFEDNGGDIKEFVMLGLRLSNGINIKNTEEKFSVKFTDDFYKQVKKFKELNCLDVIHGNIMLTEKGFLLSNTIIGKLIDKI